MSISGSKLEQYDSVRSFFEKIRAAEQSPVVLARK